MNTIRFYTIGLAALLCLSGCATQRSSKPQSLEPIIIKVTGYPGTSFTGTVVEDGQSHRVSGKADMTLQYNGRHVKCSFKQGPESGWLRFEVFAGEKRLGAAGAVGAYTRCAFSIRKDGLSSLDHWRFLGELED